MCETCNRDRVMCGMSCGRVAAASESRSLPMVSRRSMSHRQAGGADRFSVARNDMACMMDEHQEDNMTNQSTNYSRRDFMKTSATAMASLSALSLGLSEQGLCRRL